MKCNTAAQAARAEVEGTSANQEGASPAAETEKVCKDAEKHVWRKRFILKMENG